MKGITTMIETLINTNPAVFWTGIALVVAMIGCAVASVLSED